MKVLVTAGSTIIPIDRVRVISNIFGGKTGTDIAEYFFSQGDEVVLITSNPKLVKISDSHLKVIVFRTYDELLKLMEEEITTGDFDTVIHSAAVSDYQVSRVLIKGLEDQLTPLDNTKKVASTHPVLYLEMKPTQKIIDLVRQPWGFGGQLVKFKLEVVLSDQELLEIAEKSREASNADFIVANCLEWSRQFAYIANRRGDYLKTSRENLARKLRRALT